MKSDSVFKVPLSLRERVGARGTQWRFRRSNGDRLATSPHPGPLPEGEGDRLRAPRGDLRKFSQFILLLLSVAPWAAVAAETPQLADRTEPAPAELRNVKVDSPSRRPDSRSICRLSIRTAARSRCGSFFDGKRPVILTMNYSNCPMLCSLQLNGLVDAMRAMPWDAGTQFQIVTVSIDPDESPAAGGADQAEVFEALGGRRGCRDGNF